MVKGLSVSCLGFRILTLLALPQEIFKTYGSQMWRIIYKVIYQPPSWFLNAGDVRFELFWIQGFLSKGKTSQPQGCCNRWGGRLLGREWDGEKRNRLGKEDGIWTSGWGWCQVWSCWVGYIWPQATWLSCLSRKPNLWASPRPIIYSFFQNIL